MSTLPFGRPGADTGQRPFTVSELAREVQRALRPLTALLVKGEVSGLRQGGKGHYSFTIRDQGAVMEAFLFAGDARRIPTLPADGQEFIFRGRVDYWHQYGRLRFVVDWIEFDDVGRLRAQLEELKRRLEAEGAFDSRRKRPLPFLPRRVALVTSPTGAVIHDLQQTIWERFPEMDILVYPALVQGTASPGSVVTALRRCNADAAADVVVIARGGGSFEELYAFNTEPVARAILASKIPVVTALGHTSDRTLADLCADVEARTPTEAGARVVPVKAELRRQLDERDRRLARELEARLAAAEERLAARRERLRLAWPNILQRRADRLERCRAELARLSPARQLERRAEQLGERRRTLHVLAGRVVSQRAADLDRRRVSERVSRAVATRFERAQRELAHRAARLAALGPEQVLERGYAIVVDGASGRVVRTPADTAPGHRLDVRVAGGRLAATVDGE